MTTRHQITLESMLIFPLAVAVGVTLAIYTNGKLNPPHKFSLPSMGENVEILTSIPTVSISSQPEVVSQITPDGAKQVIMSVTVNEDQSKNYIIKASNTDDTNVHEIYSSENTHDLISIPFNTWSPDNKYFFINRSNPLRKDVLVFRGDGEPMDEEYKSINLTNEFGNKITDVKYDETTGWAAETLLIVDTKTSGGTKGNSFWFEVPSKAIIPLSTDFY